MNAYLPSSRPYSPPAAREAVTSRTYGASRAPAASRGVCALEVVLYTRLATCACCAAARLGWATHFTTTALRVSLLARLGVPVKGRVDNIVDFCLVSCSR